MELEAAKADAVPNALVEAKVEDDFPGVVKPIGEVEAEAVMAGHEAQVVPHSPDVWETASVSAEESKGLN